MQIALGRRGDYTVRAMLDLARHHNQGRRKAREIAASMEIPESYLPQILAGLVRASYLTAMAGPDGGYALTRAPEDITLLEIVEHAEGPVASDHCILTSAPCDWDAVCPFHDPWSSAQRAFAASLSGTTFQRLVDIDAAISAGTYRAESPLHEAPRPGPTRRRKRS